MMDSEIIVTWAQEISAGHYRKAIDVLKACQDQVPDSNSPLFRKLEVLFVLSRVWGMLYDKSGEMDELRAGQERFLCSFCGQEEDADRKILGGPIDNICNICTKEFVARFAAMK